MLFGIMFVVGVVILVLDFVIAWEQKLAANDYVVWIGIIAMFLIVAPIAKWRWSRSNDSGPSRHTYDTRSDADRAYGAGVKESEYDDE